MKDRECNLCAQFGVVCKPGPSQEGSTATVDGNITVTFTNESIDDCPARNGNATHGSVAGNIGLVAKRAIQEISSRNLE